MFQSIEEVRTQVREAGVDVFAQRNPHPFLLFAGSMMGARGKVAPTGIALGRTPAEGVCPPLGTRRVLAVRKRDVNVYASIVTIGRAPSNDIVLAGFETVSKFHAFISHAEGASVDDGWSVGDAHSSNGTFVGGQKLPPNRVARALRSHDEVRFGPDASFVFLTPKDFAERVLFG